MDVRQVALMAGVNLCVATSSLATTETTDSSSDAHFAFASYLGSGIYRTSGQQASVLNLPLYVTLEQDSDHKINLRLPVSLGFFDYQWQDLPDGDLPSSIGTATFTPGIEYSWFIDPQLTLESYLDLGVGWNFSENRQVGIYSTGVSSLYKLTPEQDAAIWVARLYTAGYNDNNRGQTETYGALHTGIDWSLGEGWHWQAHQLQPRAFAAAYWFFSPVNFNSGEKNLFADNAIELGLSLALDPVPQWLGVTLSRVGISYRYSQDLRVWRLIFDFPF
ncbi:MAG: hypothetical protein ACRCT7_00760 [Shewanella sp.]|uniref:hypothetical protein n=1 Tax=Shewanella sp. SNU WT4 TaxID=2590015 RepID=UPI00112788B1|nr:hypothetical protein [Shewanella sp. SNU WT4]QDF66720.1 hypothetical protein FJQ87_08330 [Shewanella sp. SNU WT4]